MTRNLQSRRITRGDVEAVFHAFGGGGLTGLLHAPGGGVGSPADDNGSQGSIRPFAGDAWDRAHFCSDDWHVILIAVFDGGDSSFTEQDAVRSLQPQQSRSLWMAVLCRRSARRSSESPSSRRSWSIKGGQGPFTSIKVG